MLKLFSIRPHRFVYAFHCSHDYVYIILHKATLLSVCVSLLTRLCRPTESVIAGNRDNVSPASCAVWIDKQLSFREKARHMRERPVIFKEAWEILSPD